MFRSDPKIRSVIGTLQPKEFCPLRGLRKCHRSEFENWLKSQHRLAMPPAAVSSVLGNFAGATFADNTGATTFFCEGGKLMLRTAGPDGKLHQYQVKFTFGVSPLQHIWSSCPAAGCRLSTLYGTAAPHEGRPALVFAESALQARPGSSPRELPIYLHLK
jgi:hypothetical protein